MDADRTPPKEEHLRSLSESQQRGEEALKPPEYAAPRDALRVIYEEQMIDHVAKQHVELAPNTEDPT
jgi:hypothetical protein